MKFRLSSFYRENFVSGIDDSTILRVFACLIIPKNRENSIFEKSNVINKLEILHQSLRSVCNILTSAHQQIPHPHCIQSFLHIEIAVTWCLTFSPELIHINFSMHFVRSDKFFLSISLHFYVGWWCIVAENDVNAYQVCICHCEFVKFIEKSDP